MLKTIFSFCGFPTTTITIDRMTIRRVAYGTIIVSFLRRGRQGKSMKIHDNVKKNQTWRVEVVGENINAPIFILFFSLCKRTAVDVPAGLLTTFLPSVTNHPGRVDETFKRSSS